MRLHIIVVSTLLSFQFYSKSVLSQVGTSNFRLNAYEMRGTYKENGKIKPFGPWVDGWESCNLDIFFNINNDEISIIRNSDNVVIHWFTIDSVSKYLSDNDKIITMVCKDEKRKPCLTSIYMMPASEKIFASFIINYYKDDVYFTYHLLPPKK